MAYTTPAWLRVWFIITIPIVLYDGQYLFNRPDSFTGGSKAHLFLPYNMVPWGDVDGLYSWETYKAGDGFPLAQSTVNFLEIVISLIALALGKRSSSAVLSLISVVMTASKTILYFLLEYYCGWCNTAQNPPWRFWLLYVGLNGVWVVVPTLAAVQLAKGIIKSMDARSTAAAAKKED